MELSSEDSLRLNVLIANAQAIRIDENNLVVYGLNGEREMKVALNPSGRADHYLQQVREMLSGQVLGSPGGYPVFLRRWTRMGQINNDDLDKLLMLGEPEAVVAVTRSRHLTDELARRAWWVAPYAENARRMLEHPAVVAGSMGPVLAEFLVEHLPFETEHQEMLDTVRLVLQSGLIGAETRRRLWDSGRTRKTYRVGFLTAQSEAFPEPAAARADLGQYGPLLLPLLPGNPFAGLLFTLLDSAGQTFVAVAADTRQRPADQDVVTALTNALGHYFAVARLVVESPREIATIEQMVEALCGMQEGPLHELLAAVPALTAEIHAMLFLAQIDEAIVTPIFAHTDAVGSVMRKKLEPVLQPIQQQFAVLRGGR